MNAQPPVASPLLDHCPPGLPVEAYFDPGWYAREQAAIWARQWVLVGHQSAFGTDRMELRRVAGTEVIVLRDRDGALKAFHNTCRHRGAALCTETRNDFNGRLIRCPYHAWAYDTTGRLISTGYGTPTADFDKAAHGLFPVALTEWNGLVFLCLADDPPAFRPDMGLAALDNWPMERLVVGHRAEKELACNWKIFWENYNECLHCPGIHPELIDLVPVYREGVMSEPERKGWQGGAAGPALKSGARSWTMDGAPCGPEFDGLSAEERAAGHNFVTIYPSCFVVAHVDYVRVVTVTALAPERTRLTAEWLFLPETLSAPGFDLDNVTDFAKRVIAQDGEACELNQRGLHSPKFRQGRLMPQEFDIHRFHEWVLGALVAQA